MHSLSFRLLALSISIGMGPLLGSAQAIKGHLDYQLVGFTEGRTIPLTYGIPHLARLKALKGRLTSESLKENSRLRPEVVFKKAELSLERNNQTVEHINWPSKSPLPSFCRKMRTGDRLVVKLIETQVQTKAGVKHPLADMRIIDTIVL